MKRGSFFSLSVWAVALAVFGAPGRAQAFEREWHVGGGLGLTAYPRYYSAGPALGLNAAYGLSDVFDLKLELLGSYHGYSASPGSTREHAAPYSAALGLSYKLDVLQWIPYGALLVGYQHVAGRLPVAEPIVRDDALAAILLGIDYAATRNFGLGASLRNDFLLLSASHGPAITTLLRAEYHWGF